jgi:hypothetical protein
MERVFNKMNNNLGCGKMFKRLSGKLKEVALNPDFICGVPDGWGKETLCFDCDRKLRDKWELEDTYKHLYGLYLKNFDMKSGSPVCINEWVDNELENLKGNYCKYLQETVLDDDNFDVESTEDFWTWAEVEINEIK